jgi:PKD repeat protein
LFYREDGQNYNYSSPDWEGPGTTCTIYGLSDSTTYHFVVRAYNAYEESGDSNEAHLYASSPNQVPTATFTASPLSGEAPLVVSFDASGSSDPDGMIVSCDWDFGDGGDTGVTPVHTYNTAGDYTVTLTVTDNDGATDTGTTTIQVTTPPVTNQPPAASFTASTTSGDAPLSVSFDGSGSSDPDGTVVSYDWDFGDGNTDSGVSTSYTYTSAGTYIVTLKVTDDDGATDNTTSQIQVTAANQSPAASFTANPTTGDAPLAVSFNGSSSNDPDGTIVSYSWTLGDGGKSEVVSPNHTYNSAGTFTVTLTVSDDGTPVKSDSTSMTITVTDPAATNLPPNKPVISSPYNGELEADLLLTLQAETFSDPDGDVHNMSQWQIIKQSDSAVVLEIVSSEHLTALPVPHAVLDRETAYSVSVQFYDSYNEPSEWSDPVEFTTITDTVDLDDDGIPDDSEVDDTVDLNEDGVPDNDQPGVIKSAKSAAGGKKPVGVCKLSSDIDGIVVLEPIHPSEILDKKNKPKKFFFGLAAYRLKLNQIGAATQVKVYYSEDISGANKYYLYDTVNGWQDYTEYATFNPDGRSVTLELKDGGHGDSDGVANGVIVDPGGVVGAASTGGLDSLAGGGCFIATAAFGSCVAPHVKLLRDFRDRYLLTNALGECFLRLYYKYGPIGADYIEKHNWLKHIVRVLLMPLVGIRYILVRTFLAAGILFGCLLLIFNRKARGIKRENLIWHHQGTKIPRIQMHKI